MSWALVLSGGGPMALAWQTGLLNGLRDGGADLTQPDIAVGTSAGALVAAQMLTGRDLRELFDRRCETVANAATVRGGLPDEQAWPERPLQVTALDDETGALIVWTRTAGVPLSIAVASSCSEPMVAGATTIAGRRYRDASPVSATSAELAYGHRLVLVIAAVPAGTAGARGPLDGEVAQLRAGGSHVHVVSPDAASAAALFPTRADATRGAAAAEAGYVQGAALSATAAEWLAGRHALLPVVDVEDLAARFAVPALRKAEWTHVAHLAVGAWHAHHYGAADALTRLRDGIRRLNVSIGGDNTASSGYHETITAAYVTLLTEFLDACPPGLPLAGRLARLWTSPLAERDMLCSFYSRARLFSTEARAGWVDPDLAPLRLEEVMGRPKLT